MRSATPPEEVAALEAEKDLADVAAFLATAATAAPPLCTPRLFATRGVLLPNLDHSLTLDASQVHARI